MTLAGNQPYFLPYFPYWQLIAASDVFLVSDDYDYIKCGWVNRNRILVGGKPQYFRLDVQRSDGSRLIKDRKLVPFSAATKLRTLEMAYHAAPYFAQAYPVVERILNYDGLDLLGILELSINEICGYLGIETRLVRSSSFDGNSTLRREDRIYDFCSRLGAGRYINSIGGQALYSKDEFLRRGVELRFLKSTVPPYCQALRHRRHSTWGRDFIPDLSVLDAMMFNSREQLHDMLDCYELI